jgi:hypothetical protein
MLPVRLDSFLDIAGKVIVHYRARSARSQVGDRLGNQPAPGLDGLITATAR